MTRIKFIEGFGQGTAKFEKFANRIKEKLDKYKSYKDIGIIVSEIQRDTPRYIYIKHREHSGKKYLVDIDLLERNFSIVEE